MTRPEAGDLATAALFAYGVAFLAALARPETGGVDLHATNPAASALP